MFATCIFLEKGWKVARFHNCNMLINSCPNKNLKWFSTPVCQNLWEIILAEPFHQWRRQPHANITGKEFQWLVPRDTLIPPIDAHESIITIFGATKQGLLERSRHMVKTCKDNTMQGRRTKLKSYFTPLANQININILRNVLKRLDHHISPNVRVRTWPLQDYHASGTVALQRPPALQRGVQSFAWSLALWKMSPWLFPWPWELLAHVYLAKKFEGGIAQTRHQIWT